MDFLQWTDMPIKSRLVMGDYISQYQPELAMFNDDVKYNLTLNQRVNAIDAFNRKVTSQGAMQDVELLNKLGPSFPGGENLGRQFQTMTGRQAPEGYDYFDQPRTGAALTKRSQDVQIRGQDLAEQARRSTEEHQRVTEAQAWERMRRDAIKEAPASVQQGYIQNQSMKNKLKMAIDLMEGKDVVATGPDGAPMTFKGDRNATGVHGFIGEVPIVGQQVLNYVDSLGVDARAAMADVGSLVIHDRSGAAVTAAEFPRLRPFIPVAGDRPEDVRRKLKRMYAVIQEESQAMEDTYSAARGYRGVGGQGTPVARQSYNQPTPGPQPSVSVQNEALMQELKRRGLLSNVRLRSQ